MSILWAGGEDIDFPNNSGLSVSTTSTTFRSGYGRCAIHSSSTSIGARSLVFSGGAVTSCWFTCEFILSAVTGNNAIGIGLTKDGSTPSGLYVGGGASTAAKLTLYKYDGTTKTALASESGTSLTTSTLLRLDVEITSYGASATVNVYLGAVLLITFSGDVTVSGVTSLSAVGMGPLNTSTPFYYSEIIVADEDTRPFLGLLTMAPTAIGTTNDWSNNTVTNVNPTTINDANATSTNTVSKDQQYNLTDEPAGTFNVKAIRIAARAFITSGATASKIKLGFNSGGSVAVSSAQTVATGATTYENIYSTNPVTSADWGDSTEINALQVDLQSSS